MVMHIFSKPVYNLTHVREFYRGISLSAEYLKHRAVVKLSGAEVLTFMQGLVTNDMSLLTNQQNSLYTFLLNSKGRILYDSLIYRISSSEVLLECDSLVRDDIIKHIKAYCIRKKIDFIPQDSSIWVIYNDGSVCDVNSHPSLDDTNNISSVNEGNIKKAIEADALVFRDPRLPSLGIRIVSPPSLNITEVLSNSGLSFRSSQDFTTIRYTLGVAEGVNELPVGSCFPHEANGDFLRGISFNKGCYIGQELTARVQHTGVVRKRLMPLILSCVPDFEVEENCAVTSINDKSIGKLRALWGKHGIALLRVAEALEKKSTLTLSGISVQTYKPSWWLS